MPVLRVSEPTNADDLEEGGERKWPVIPEDTICDVRVAAIKDEEKPFKNDDGSPVVKMVFEFVVTDGEYQGSKVWGETGVKLANHPDCRLRNWLQEIAGTALDTDVVVDTDDFVGGECRIVIGNRSWNDKVTNEKKTRHFAKDVLRSRNAPATSTWDEEPF